MVLTRDSVLLWSDQRHMEAINMNKHLPSLVQAHISASGHARLLRAGVWVNFLPSPPFYIPSHLPCNYRGTLSHCNPLILFSLLFPFSFVPSDSQSAKALCSLPFPTLLSQLLGRFSVCHSSSQSHQAPLWMQPAGCCISHRQTSTPCLTLLGLTAS